MLVACLFYYSNFLNKLPVKNIKVEYKRGSSFKDKELINLRAYQEAFRPNAIKFNAANVVRIGTSLFLADII